MRTEFALLAVYNSPLISLKDFVENEMGIKLSTARNRIAAGTFPVKVIKMGGGLMVHAEDAAELIDRLRKEAPEPDVEGARRRMKVDAARQKYHSESQDEQLSFSREMMSHDEVVENAVPMPPWSGVYFLIKDGQVVYVGQSTNIPARIGAHRAEKEFDGHFILPCHKHEMDVIESIYIHHLKPKLNSFQASIGRFVAPLSIEQLEEMSATDNEVRQNG